MIAIFAVVSDLQFKIITIYPTQIRIAHYSRSQLGDCEMINWGTG
jgi:hypothetical protein